MSVPFSASSPIAAAALATLMALVLAGAGVPSARAQGSTCGPSAAGATCGGAGVATQGDGEGAPIGAGNPIHLVTGNKTLTEVDLPPLPGALGLEIVRHYNSVHAAPGVPATGVGRGWRLSYDTELRAGPTSVQILQADGSRLVFRRDAADPASCASDDPRHGRLAARRTRDGEAFDWHWPDGRVLAFDVRGRLVQIRLPEGDRKTLQRDARGDLVSVTDPQGRRLVVVPGVEAAGGWRGIAAFETPVGRFTLRHGDGSTGADATTLVAVQRPHAEGGTVERRYHHEDARFPTLLTGVSVAGPDGLGGRMALRVSTYRYGDDGRATASMLGSADAPTHRVEVDRSRAGETRIVAADGTVTVARHGLVGGRWRLLEVTGPGCAGCPPSPMRFAYDDLGRVIEETALDAAGRPLRSRSLRRDAQGRLVETTVTDPRTGAVVVERLAYEGTSPDPARIERDGVVVGRPSVTTFERDAQGRLLRVVEAGFSPIDAEGRPLPTGLDGRVPAAHAARATAIVRETRYRHAEIAGRSRLVAIDGPLANGPAGTPDDSDVTRLHWDARGDRVVRVESPGGRSATLTHDDAGRQVQVRDADGSTLRWQLDPRGTVVATEARALADGPGWVRTWRLDAMDRRVEQREGLRGADGRLVADADAAQWRAGWDVAGRPTWRLTAAGDWRRWTWDAGGRLQSLGQGAGGQHVERRWETDTAGRPWRASDATGPIATLHRDATGAVVAVEDALGRVVGPAAARGAPRLRHLHDDFGRLVARLSVDHGDRVDRHDAADRPIESRDARGAVSRLRWDLRDRPVEQVLSMPGAQPEVTRWHWDGARLAAVDHPVQRERYRHDDQGRLVARTVTWSQADGTAVDVVQRWAYDDRGRLAGWTLADGSWLRLQRDGRGQVTAVRRDRLETPWLRPLLPSRLLASGLERDAVGPTRVVFGNGMASQRLRAADGALVRVWHGPAEAPAPSTTARTAAAVLPSMLGVGVAHASPARPPAAVSTPTPDGGGASGPPGWIGRPAQAGVRVDERYLWDRAGNLLVRESRGDATPGEPHRHHHLYDDRDQLLQTVRRGIGTDEPSRVLERFAYDDDANRRVAQVPGGPAEVAQRSWPAAGSHRIDRIDAGPGAARRAVTHDAGGHPVTDGDRRYTWDAAGRLVAVHAGERRLAAYAFDHRGQRVRRTDAGGTVLDLHDDRRRAAEIAPDGQVRRLWVWLADLPIAVIDPAGAPAADIADDGPVADLRRDLRTLRHAWRADGERIAYLHTDHLGAPVLATGDDGRTLWQARYGSFGRAQAVSAVDGFTLDLRLPGQHEDAATGLHHNDHRTYDPDTGRYLSPDPLGAPDGPNPYVYVRNNPLKHVDPSGLVLFAFDGTGNTLASRTNVRHFAEAYDDFSAFDRARGYHGLSFYMEGPGTGEDGVLDAMFGLSLNRRIGQQMNLFEGYVRENWAWHVGRSTGGAVMPLTITLDVVGFSRGAAMARHFSHQVADFHRSAEFRHRYGTCLSVLQRLLALFDTVLSFNGPALTTQPLRMAVPPEVAVAVHAVAMNERRAMFPGETVATAGEAIADVGAQTLRPVSRAGGGEPQRLERGFVGAHADIGGGYTVGPSGGDLSDLALMWMVQRAREAGVTMRPLAPEQRRVSSPVVHDERRTGIYRVSLQPLFRSRDIVVTEPPTSRPPPTDVGDANPDLLSTPPGQDPGRRTDVDQSGVTGSQGMSQRTAQRWVQQDPDARWLSSANGRIADLCGYLDWLRRHYAMTIEPHPGCGP